MALKFKERNEFANKNLKRKLYLLMKLFITDALPLLKERCFNYPPERIYNMDETGLFYR
jgi:hypothetical protein